MSVAFEEPQKYALKRAHRSHTSAAETKMCGDLRVCHRYRVSVSDLDFMADASQDRDWYSEMLHNNPDLMEAVYLLARHERSYQPFQIDAGIDPPQLRCMRLPNSATNSKFMRN